MLGAQILDLLLHSPNLGCANAQPAYPSLPPMVFITPRIEKEVKFCTHSYQFQLIPLYVKLIDQLRGKQVKYGCAE